MDFLSWHYATSAGALAGVSRERRENMSKEETNSLKTSETSGSTTSDEWYDLLPVEKKLILTSLSLGIALLVIFVFAFGIFLR